MEPGDHHQELGSPQVSQEQKEAGTEPKTASTRWDPRKGGAWPAKSPTHRVWGQTRATSCQVPRMDAVGTLTSPALWVESDISATRRQTSVWSKRLQAVFPPPAAHCGPAVLGKLVGETRAPVTRTGVPAWQVAQQCQGQAEQKRLEGSSESQRPWCPVPKGPGFSLGGGVSLIPRVGTGGRCPLGPRRLTSAVALAQVGKPPEVAQAHGKAHAAEQVL